MQQMVEHSLGRPGEVVTASVRNPLEDAASKGKPRPAILIRRIGGHWWVMGLTTRATYNTGAARTQVPNPSAVGLRRPGFLWGNRLTKISAMDVDLHIGWVDAELAAAVIALAGLGVEDCANLIRAVVGRQEAA